MQLTTTRLQAQIQFIVEIDKLKHVLRQTLLMDKLRERRGAFLAFGDDGDRAF
jgi:putative hydrolase of HD superfamily